jgi:DNA-directed RNA polymerase subunit RPC12/RpoP
MTTLFPYTEVHECIRVGDVFECPYCAYRLQVEPTVKVLTPSPNPYVTHRGASGGLQVEVVAVKEVPPESGEKGEQK